MTQSRSELLDDFSASTLCNDKLRVGWPKKVNRQVLIITASYI